MAGIQETRETTVVTDAQGNVTETMERGRTVPPRRSGFGKGALFGIALAALAIALFAYSQGSFRNAGADTDRAAIEVKDQAGVAAENAGAALETAGDKAKAAGENLNRDAPK
jgi:hypothetical protein